MFDPTRGPRLFALPCGVDFGQAVIDGLHARLAGQPPEAIARTTLILNTTRMQRRITDLFDRRQATFLPRLRLLTTLDAELPGDAGETVSPLARRLELVELVRELIDLEPDIAPATAAFDLADSLAGLMDELRSEGLDPSVIAGLDVTDQSGHWQRAQKFLAIVTRFFAADARPDAMQRQAEGVERLLSRWAAAPPTDPVIVAGSTGSRGLARRLIEVVAHLPQGAVILPGHDTEMPAHGWESLRGLRGPQEDHPQYRHLALCDALGCDPAALPLWDDSAAPAPARNALVSLALRPAPVTHVWRAEGRKLTGLDAATRGMTLLEAQSQRDEALAIALRLRQAADTGQSAALISPDRILTRLTTMMLDQWGIVPDDSAGIPLHLTAPGRFLRHVADLQGDRVTAEALLIVLKHPLCHSGSGRNQHLRHTRDLELYLRRNGPPHPDAGHLAAFGAEKAAGPWAAWLAACLGDIIDPHASVPMSTRQIAHRDLAERLAAGPEETGSGQLWKQLAGVAVRDLVERFAEATPSAGRVTAREYLSVFSAILAGEQQTDRDAGDPLIRIWGTLEARVMGADLIILGGLNEGTWPEAPAPDPWLNRALRKQAGMLLPERRIGLSAHDFQQAVGATEVWLTRPIRADGAQTVPSRWLNRLTNLLGGLEAGAPALEAMRARGAAWTRLARAFETVVPTPAAIRPSPRPPLDARPRRLSVTQISSLIRDPYAIYARHILGLSPLDPLVKSADAALRGTAMHLVFERLLKSGDLSKETLMRLAHETFESDVPWPEIRLIWEARIARIADHFLAEEALRQQDGTPVAFERKGALDLASLGFVLRGKADRIDRRSDGTLAIFDYKTGPVPTPKQQRTFDKQLLLMAAMAEAGGFDDIPPSAVTRAAYIGLGTTPKTRDAPLKDMPPARIRAELETLIGAMLSRDFGFTSRRAMQSDREERDYDHLARFGEWDTTDPAMPEDLT